MNNTFSKEEIEAIEGWYSSFVDRFGGDEIDNIAIEKIRKLKRTYTVVMYPNKSDEEVLLVTHSYSEAMEKFNESPNTRTIREK